MTAEVITLELLLTEQFYLDMIRSHNLRQSITWGRFKSPTTILPFMEPQYYTITKEKIHIGITNVLTKPVFHWTTTTPLYSALKTQEIHHLTPVAFDFILQEALFGELIY